MLTHEAVVAEIAAQVKFQRQSGHTARIAKGSVSHVVPNPHAKRAPRPAIDASKLTNILSIDAAGRTCAAEAGVTFEQLVRATLPHGLIPATVPELKGITIGGAVSGCSVESMSYKHGGFHDSCLEYELVDGTGLARTLSRERDPELFEMVHGSYGTLGVLTRLTFRLVPAKPFVHMRYATLPTLEAFDRAVGEAMGDASVDFIDAIIHARDRFVLCLGRMVDRAPYAHRYDWLKIYYRSTRERAEDYLTTPDYLFRYDAECHWCTRTVPLLERKPVRFLLGKAVLGSTNLITWSRRLRPLLALKRRPEVVVDLFIPKTRFAEFYRWYERTIGYFPLWIVPYRAPRLYPWIADDYARRMGGTFFFDVAVYGMPNARREVDYDLLLEQKTTEVAGLKTLIAPNHYDEATFWSIFSRERYQAAKAALDPHGVFQDLYDKFRPGA
jgi:FAD/FMN-containing dehydrogenase